MNRLSVSPLLRWALGIDAVASASSGLLLVAFAAPLHTVFHLPAGLLAGVGLFSLLYAAVIARMARRGSLPRWSVWAVVIGNAIWALDCALIALSGWWSPSPLGLAYLWLQAVLVFGFAELQYLGLRRAHALTTTRLQAA